MLTAKVMDLFLFYFSDRGWKGAHVKQTLFKPAGSQLVFILTASALMKETFTLLKQKGRVA